MPFHICPIKIMAIISVVPFIGAFSYKALNYLHRMFSHKH